MVSLRSLADARLIRELSAQSEDVVILGGGFIGLEIAATLKAAGRKVTVVEAVDRLLGRAVAPVIASHVRQRLEATGVRILTGTTIARLEGENGHVSAAITSTGERLPAQMVIIGIGVVPNVELAQAAGITIANGIRVDHQMRSSVPEILAIGDAASYRHWFTGGDVRLESVQNATDQARLAARTIVGHADTYSAVPWFWSDIGDMKLQMVGLTVGRRQPCRAGRPGGEQILDLPLCRQPAARHRIGQSPRRPYAGPQDARRRLLADAADGGDRTRRTEGGAGRLSAEPARAAG